MVQAPDEQPEFSTASTVSQSASVDDKRLSSGKSGNATRPPASPGSESSPSLTEQRMVDRATRLRSPYYNVVRLSVGCTGTLITPRHVLTAAHCLHTGLAFRPSVRRLRVELPSAISSSAAVASSPSWSGTFNSRRVAAVHIPRGWIKADGVTKKPASDAVRAMHDYAVLELLSPAGGQAGRRYPAFGVPGGSVISQPRYAGFPSDKGYRMLEARCPFDSRSDVHLGGNLILSPCRATGGTSGSPVFVTVTRPGRAAGVSEPEDGGGGGSDRRILGLVSSSMLVSQRRQNRQQRQKQQQHKQQQQQQQQQQPRPPSDTPKTRVTVINNITKRKRLTICAMIAWGAPSGLPLSSRDRHASVTASSVASCRDLSADSANASNAFHTLFVNALYTH